MLWGVLHWLFYAKLVHRTADKASFVERATHLEFVTFYFRAAVVGLAIAWVVDISTDIPVTLVLQSAEHIESHKVA